VKAVKNPFSVENLRKKREEKAKEPLTAYLQFSSDVRSKIQEEQPALTFAGLSQEISRRWRTLPS
jgi:hypothetical protein